MPDAILVTPDVGAKRLHRASGGHDIITFKQTTDPGGADCKSAENQRTVGNRLVSGHIENARQTAMSRRLQFVLEHQ